MRRPPTRRAAPTDEFAIPALHARSPGSETDTGLFGEVLSGKITRADADTARRGTGYSIGGTPPFGHARPLRTVVDATLIQYDRVWAAAGTPETVFEITTTDLVRCARGNVADFTT